MLTGDIPPNQSIYIKNLNDKVRKQAEKKGSQQSANGVSSESNGGTPASSHPHGSSSGQDSTTAPNNILFLQNLPHNTTSLMLQKLFEQYPGFREVRTIDAKPGIAFVKFVEFEDDMQASVAMQALQDFKITPQNPMVISYAKK